MNPVFWILGILVLALLWFLLSRFFVFIGSVSKRMEKTIKNELNKDNEDTKDVNS